MADTIITRKDPQRLDKFIHRQASIIQLALAGAWIAVGVLAWLLWNVIGLVPLVVVFAPPILFLFRWTYLSPPEEEVLVSDGDNRQ